MNNLQAAVQTAQLHERMIQVVSGDGCRNDSEYAELRNYMEGMLHRAYRMNRYADAQYWETRLEQLQGV